MAILYNDRQCAHLPVVCFINRMNPRYFVTHHDIISIYIYILKLLKKKRKKHMNDLGYLWLSKNLPRDATRSKWKRKRFISEDVMLMGMEIEPRESSWAAFGGRCVGWRSSKSSEILLRPSGSVEYQESLRIYRNLEDHRNCRITWELFLLMTPHVGICRAIVLGYQEVMSGQGALCKLVPRDNLGWKPTWVPWAVHIWKKKQVRNMEVS